MSVVVASGLAILAWSTSAGAGTVAAGREVVELLAPDGRADSAALEVLLSPGEFSSRLLLYISRDDEAAFSLDSSLTATQPFAELHPERLTWPRVGGIELWVEQAEKLELRPVELGISDADLDDGFDVHWFFEAVGQRFEPRPHFVVTVGGAEVRSSSSGRLLLAWRAPEKPPVCSQQEKPGEPECVLSGVGLEIRAVALSADGRYLSAAHGGLRPRLDVFDLKGTPRLAWQALFDPESGGAVETAFSADGTWVVALTGKGTMHRFVAKTGESHLRIPSKGRTACEIPPGFVMAVAGDAGEVTLWYLSDGTIAWRLPPRDVSGPVDILAVSADGRRLATLEYGEEATLVRIWQLGRRRMLREIAVDPYAVADIALDRRGETLYVAHEEEGLLAARVEGGKLQPLGTNEAGQCTGKLRYLSGEDEVSCSVAGGEIRLDRAGRLTERLSIGHEGRVFQVLSSADGAAAVAVGGGLLKIWRRRDASGSTPKGQ